MLNKFFKLSEILITKFQQNLEFILVESCGIFVKIFNKFYKNSWKVSGNLRLKFMENMHKF